MLVLRAGLYVAGVGALFTAWASLGAGYPAEVAILRGLVAFMAMSVLGYAGEIVVATAPPARRREATVQAEAEHHRVNEEAEGGESGMAPVSLEAVRAQGRIGTPGNRQAA